MEDGDVIATPPLHKRAFLGPITCLEWVPETGTVLSGSGNFVHVSASGSVRVFDYGRVHGTSSRVISSNRSGSDDEFSLVVAVYSEKRVAIMRLAHPPLKDYKGLITPSGPITTLPELDDWILEVRLVTPPRSKYEQGLAAAARWGWFAVGFAHNFVEIWNWARGGSKIRRIKADDQPVLMSMAFHGDSASSLAVAAAGFTREIMVWSLPPDESFNRSRSASSEDDSPTQIVRMIEQRLTGHTGVIHALRWRRDGQVLLSAAEDRSVRVWRCMSENDIANENSAQDACLSQLVLVSTLWGHAARIWGCDVFQDVVSTASEDGSSRIYRVPSLLGPPLIRSESREGSPIAFQGAESSEEGRCVGVLRGHQGKHVWRVVLCPSAKLVGCARVDSRDDASEDAVLRVATGGNDATVRLYMVPETQGRPRDAEAGPEAEGGGEGDEPELAFDTEAFSIPTFPDDVVRSDEVPPGGGREEFVRCVTLTHDGSAAVCGTNQGRVLLLDLTCAPRAGESERPAAAWHCLLAEPALQFTAIAVHGDWKSTGGRAFAMLGDALGAICVVCLSVHAGPVVTPRTVVLRAHLGHVMDIFLVHPCVSLEARGGVGAYSADNPATPEGGIIKRWALHASSDSSFGTSVPSPPMELAKFRMGTKCRITCLVEAEIIPSSIIAGKTIFGKPRQVFVCGDRKGNLGVFLLAQSSEFQQAQEEWCDSTPVTSDRPCESACFLERRAHRQNSVTALVLEHSSGLLYSTGRDGAVCMWRLVCSRDSRGGLDVSLIKEGAVQGWGKMELITGVSWTESRELLITGFQHMRFVVRHVPQRRTLVSIVCGGARRPYAFHFAGGGSDDAQDEIIPECVAGTKQCHNLVLTFVRDGMLHVSKHGQQDGRSALGMTVCGGKGTWFHGREVHSIEHVTDCSLITASEDGTLKILDQREVHDAALLCSATLEGERHVQLGAALRCFASFDLKSGDRFLVAGGAKDVLVCWLISPPGNASRGMRLLSTVRLPSQKAAMRRFMSLEAFSADACQDADGDIVAVIVGADDALVRLLFFHIQRREWLVGALMRRHASTLLSSSSAWILGRRLVVTGGADGVVAIWDVSSIVDRALDPSSGRAFQPEGEFGGEGRGAAGRGGRGGRGARERLETSTEEDSMTVETPLWSMQRHQSGINGETVRIYSSLKPTRAFCDEVFGLACCAPSEFHIFCDDQKLCSLRFTFSLSESCDGLVLQNCKEGALVVGAHASTIRGVCVAEWNATNRPLPSVTTSGCKAVAVTVGADQRVNVWGMPRLELLASDVTEVCDATCVDAKQVAGGALQIAVAGMGAQTMQLAP